MSEPVVITSQQTMTVRDRHVVTNAEDFMDHLEGIVRHEFNKACRQQGVVVDEMPEPVWICRMEAHGVRSGDGRP